MVGDAAGRLPTSGRMLAVAIGDVASIAAFVAVGELSHGRAVLSGAGTFAAFLVGWFVAAVLVDAYGPSALSSLSRAVVHPAVAWTLAALLGQAVRALVVPGANIAPSFVLVSILVGGLFLVSWRLFAALTFAAV